LQGKSGLLQPSQSTVKFHGNRKRRSKKQQPKSSFTVEWIPEGEQRDMTRDLELSLISVDSRGNIRPKMPEAAIVACQTYMMTTQPAPDDPCAATHRTALASLGIVGQHLEKIHAFTIVLGRK
jgi:hypothetical protein